MYHQPNPHTALPRARLQPITRQTTIREAHMGFAHDMLEMSAHPALTTELPTTLIHTAPTPGRTSYTLTGRP